MANEREKKLNAVNNKDANQSQRGPFLKNELGSTVLCITRRG